MKTWIDETWPDLDFDGLPRDSVVKEVLSKFRDEVARRVGDVSKRKGVYAGSESDAMNDIFLELNLK